MAPPKGKIEVPLRVRALRLLGRREHSRLELERKLGPFAADPGELSTLLSEFEGKGWLSERRVVEQVASGRRRRFGSLRIAHELREKGISEDAIAAALSDLKPSELDRAREVWRTKFGKLPQNAAERARQARFMQSRGFSVETVMRVLRAGRATDEE